MYDNENQKLSKFNIHGGHAKGTQLLTPKGWKEISQINKDDFVLQWNLDGSMNFTNPIEVSNNDVPYTLIIKNQQSHVSQEVSPNHFLLYDYKGRLQEVQANSSNQIKNKNVSNYINTGKIGTKEREITVRDRILIAIQADGYFNNPVRRTGERIGAVPVMFSFAKSRKSDRLIELAAEAELRLDDRKVDNRGRQNWALYIPTQDTTLWPRDKKLSSISEFDLISWQWCIDFINEASLWDGHIIKENNSRITWRCIDRENAEYIQAVASLAGYRTHFSERADKRKETYSDIYTVQISKHNYKTSVQSVEVQKHDQSKTVYSVKVPSKYLLTRKDGGVIITGS